MVNEISSDDLRRLIVLPGQAPRTRNGNRRALHGFFEWCVRQELCTTNPVAKIDPAKVEEARPEILSLADVKNLLRIASSYKSGIMVPYFAISLFAGLRPAELERIAWADIDLENQHLTLDGRVTKLRKLRSVKLADNLISWLLPYVGKPIVGINHRRDFDAVRRLVGFRARSTDSDPTLTPWPDDVLRHTALSYHFALYQHEGKTARWAGNSPDILHRHYKGLVKPADVQLYWSLTPETLESTIIPLRAKG